MDASTIYAFQRRQLRCHLNRNQYRDIVTNGYSL